MAFRHAVIVGGLTVLAVACGSSSPGGPSQPSVVTFPKMFMWGTASAAFQVEKGNGNTDWGHWVATPGKIKNGDSPDVGGPDALAHIADDVATMKNAGITAYRFSIEWARVFPTQAAFTANTPDATAVAAYSSLLTQLEAAGITPLVTAIHYSLPDWLDDVTMSGSPQGFERPDAPDLVGTWCSRLGALFGANVDWWATLNEPVLPPLAGYIAGQNPPGLYLDSARALTYIHGEAMAHVKCYDALHAADTVDADGDGKAAQVSLVSHSRKAEPLDPTNPDDVQAAKYLQYVTNQWFWNAVVLGNWDDELDMSLTGPNDRTGDPSLKGRADYLGLNYYSDMICSRSKGVIIPMLNVAAPSLYHQPTQRPKGDDGDDIYPDGFGPVIDELKPYALPIVITENGIADRDDVNRPRFIAEHLYQVGWAMQRGMDIRGYFHWSLLDNFEWASGYCPKFGLQSVDPSTAARTPRKSLSVYSGIIRAGKVGQADIAALPGYTTTTACP